MSADNIRPFKPSPASEILYQAIKSHRDREHPVAPDSSQVPSPHHGLAESPSPPSSSTTHTSQSEAAGSFYPGAFIDDISSDFREWCETKRTCWPTSLVEFLSDIEFMFAKDLGDDPHSPRGYQTRRDYSWVPSVLCDIFHNSLPPEPMLHILEYFLSLLSVLILSDATTVEGEAHFYRDLLLRTVAPSQDSLIMEPNFLGALDPADASDHTPRLNLEPMEISLVRDIRRQLYLHTIQPM